MVPLWVCFSRRDINAQETKEKCLDCIHEVLSLGPGTLRFPPPGCVRWRGSWRWDWNPVGNRDCLCCFGAGISEWGPCRWRCVGGWWGTGQRLGIRGRWSRSWSSSGTPSLCRPKRWWEGACEVDPVAGRWDSSHLKLRSGSCSLSEKPIMLAKTQ